MAKSKSQISGVQEHASNLPQHFRIFLAGHRGMVGSAIYRRLQADNYQHLITRSHDELDLINQTAVRHFFENEKIEKIITKAPGNGVSMDGLKVITKGGWFAARPSGTENIYKIYAESFRSEDHLNSILEDQVTNKVPVCPSWTRLPSAKDSSKSPTTD